MDNFQFEDRVSAYENLEQLAADFGFQLAIGPGLFGPIIFQYIEGSCLIDTPFEIICQHGESHEEALTNLLKEAFYASA